MKASFYLNSGSETIRPPYKWNSAASGIVRKGQIEKSGKWNSAEGTSGKVRQVEQCGK